MNDIILNALCCPICGSPFAVENGGKSLLCLGNEKRHCYDFASGGYINFAPPSQSRSGDSKEAVRSRTEFLEKGFYAPIRDAVLEMTNKYGGELFIDAGCGEGYYSDAIAAHGHSLIGFDLSKAAINTAAKRAVRNQHENAFFGVAGIYDMPIIQGVADGVVSIFAPCAHEEFCRILKKEGILVVAGAGKEHLLGLKEAIYDQAYVNTDREDMPLDMTLVCEREIRYDIALTSNKEIMDLFSMTPYYYRTGEQDLAKLSRLDNLTSQVDVKICLYRK